MHSNYAEDNMSDGQIKKCRLDLKRWAEKSQDREAQAKINSSIVQQRSHLQICSLPGRNHKISITYQQRSEQLTKCPEPKKSKTFKRTIQLSLKILF